MRLGIDVGTVRIGVARSDRDGLLAVPVETVPRVKSADGSAVDPRGADVRRLVALVDEYSGFEVIVGLPLSLSGGDTASTADARRLAQTLADLLPVPVRLVDERLSSVTANAQLRQAGRTSRTSRSVVDQAAAVIIVQHALDAERSSGREPGTLVDPTPSPSS